MDSEKATFYNNEEDWEFQTPIEPLLKNEVFAAMLSGQFKESNTKRICLPGFSKSVVQQFISDLTEGKKGEQKFNQNGDAILFNIKLTRLAHQFNQKNLIEEYARDAIQSLWHFHNLSKEVAYELVKLVFDLSLVNYKDSVFQHCQHKLDVMLELDDHVLMKELCGIQGGQYTTNWISPAIQHKAFKCLKVIFEDTRRDMQQYALQLLTPTLILPDDLLRSLITNYPRTIDDLFQTYGGTRLSTATLGALLRVMNDSFDIWHRTFEEGYLEIVKFAPKSMLIINNGQKSFGMTAITKGWINCVELLLSEGWDPRPTNALTAALNHLDPKLIQLLMSHGAVPNVETVRTMTNVNLRKMQFAAESATCLYLIEQAALANAFESDIYKAYTSKPAEINS